MNEQERDLVVDRRKFLTYASVVGVSALAGGWSTTLGELERLADVRRRSRMVAPNSAEFAWSASIQSTPENNVRHAADILHEHPDADILDNLASVNTYDPKVTVSPIADEMLRADELALMKQVFARLARVQSLIGYGNFNVIGWDETLRHAERHPDIGEFTVSELDFIEQIFSLSAASIGFYGDKVVTQLSSTIKRNDIKKIPHTGHYLYRGDALQTYSKIRRDIGDTIILTSGIRSVVKQIYLFLNKAIQVNGNLSLASYSLAPPGHSYHAIGDFDVGKVGLGARNFTDEFSMTDEFKRLSDFGYFDIRYPQNNPYGVRYEPWHIKVV